MQLRYPALFAAAVAGALLLVLAAAAYPLFLSATSSDLIRGAIDRPNITRYLAGLTYTFKSLPLDPVRVNDGLQTPAVRELNDAFGRLASGSPVLGGPLAAVLGDPVALSFEGRAGTQAGRLFASPGVLAHVERLSGVDGDGVWLPELIANELGVRPGDEVHLLSGDGARASEINVRVDGVYRDIYFAWPPGGYWLQWQDEFRLVSLGSSPPAQPILADFDQVIELTRELGGSSATFSWQAPVAAPTGVTLEDVRSLDAYQAQVGTFSFGETPIGRILGCCGRWGPPVEDAETTFGSLIHEVVEEAERRIATIQGPAQVLELAALAVALVVVAAAGAFGMRTRRVEAAWLFARGTSPARVGARNALESVLPSITGGVLGLLLAVVVVTLLGPGGSVDRAAYADAAARSAVALVGSILLTSIVAEVAFVRIVSPHDRRFARLVAAVPVELVVVWLSYIALRRLDHEGAFFTDPALGVSRPSLALVAFPSLLLAGFAFLGGRLAHLIFGLLRRPTSRASPSIYLAARRLATGGTLVIALIGAAGLCLGLFLHAQAVATSLETTVTAKARVFVGSDVAASIDYISQAPPDFPFPVTRVVQVGEGARLPSGRTLDLLAVDPGSFAEAAYWNDAFAAEPIQTLVRELRVPSEGGPLPVVLAAAGELDVSEILVGTTEVPVEVVARPKAFPGLFSLRPLVVVDEQGLLERLDSPLNPLQRHGAELWIRGEPGAVRRALATLQVAPSLIVTAAEVEDIPAISAAIDTFLIINALGLIAAALTFVGMLMYLQARQRSQIVSYALSIRMGMQHGQHRRALAIELGGMIAVGFAVGGGLAILAARVTVPLLDPIPTIPPKPLFLIPGALFVLTAALAGLLTWSGAAFANRRARAVDLGEVMRVAE